MYSIKAKYSDSLLSHLQIISGGAYAKHRQRYKTDRPEPAKGYDGLHFVS
jgi:hypothetical protein